MPFISKQRHEELLSYKSEAKQLKRDHKQEVKELTKSIESQEKYLAEARQEIKVLESLNNDAIATKTLKLKLDEDEKLLKQREENVENKEEAKENEESAQYKHGYEDGVADGLRKGYDLTAQDRQNLSSIAALAAASHSDGATKAIAEQIVIGMQKQNELPETTKSK